MPAIKPLIIAAYCALTATYAFSQVNPAIIQKKPPKKKFNYILSWNAGIFSFPKSFTAFDINLPYTATDVATGNITTGAYKTSITNFFTRPAYMLDIFNLEVLTKKQGLTWRVSLSPNYFRSYPTHSKNELFNFVFGYERLFPLHTTSKNEFVFKPSISVSFFQAQVGFDNTIDNQNKILNISGKTFNTQFRYVDDDDDEQTAQASYLQLAYTFNSVALFPQVCLARQSAVHKFYYSVNVGWIFQVSDYGSIIFNQHDDQGHTSHETSAHAKANYNFSGVYGGVSVGLYFDRVKHI